MIKQTKPDLEDLSRHAVREELRKIAEEYECGGGLRNSEMPDSDILRVHGRSQVDVLGVQAGLVYQDPALIALRAKLGGGGMNITAEKLTEMRACSEGMAWFMAQKVTELKPLCYALVEDQHASWANWLLTRLMTKSQRVAYAIFAAEQVLDIFEVRYPDDKRPRMAIEAAKNYLADPSDANRRDAAYDAAAAAHAAYNAAAHAAHAAYNAAAHAAYDAAYAAADAAAHAAHAAYNAAAAAYNAAAAAAHAAHAAYDAAYAAADAERKKMQLTIVDYGVRLLEEPTK